MGTEIALLKTLVSILTTHGLLGATVILFGVLLWLLRQHGKERRAWMIRYDDLHKRTLDTISKNTEALAELKTLVSLVVMKNRG